MKKVLITGASGFIGGFFVEEAFGRDFEVYAGVRSSSNLEYLSQTELKILKIDLSDKDALKSMFRKQGKFDFIIHNAGITKSFKRSNYDKVNYLYTKNLIDAFTEANCVPDKFIYMSSLAAYGPGDENTMEPVKESDIPSPITLYGKSKLKAEQYIQSCNNLPYLIFRPTGVYGPREKDFFILYKTINQGLETYIGRYTQHITFIYVQDLVRLIFDALSSNITRKSYFVTDLNRYTAKDFNLIVKQVLGKKTIKIIFPKTLVKLLAFINEKTFWCFGKSVTLNMEKYKEISSKNWLCDSSETVKDFGFVPEYGLMEGIVESLAWYKNENLL